MLSKFSERYRGRTYSVLVRKALGRKLSASATHALLVHSMCPEWKEQPTLSHGENVVPLT